MEKHSALLRRRGKWILKDEALYNWARSKGVGMSVIEMCVLREDLVAPELRGLAVRTHNLDRRTDSVEKQIAG